MNEVQRLIIISGPDQRSGRVLKSVLELWARGRGHARGRGRSGNRGHVPDFQDRVPDCRGHVPDPLIRTKGRDRGHVRSRGAIRDGRGVLHSSFKFYYFI